VQFTGPAYFTNAMQFLNEAVKTTYTLDRFLRGKNYDKVIQSGEKIKDDVMFDESRTFQRYQPNAEFTWTQPQVATEMEINWRFATDHMSWTDQEIELNINTGFSREYANVQYKNLRKKIEQRMWTSMINGMEEELWATPHGQTAQMESSDGSNVYSIPAYITEDDTNYHGTGWTTVMGINPATETKWRNQVSKYSFDNPFDIGTLDAGSLIQALDDMWLKVRFMPPKFHQEHFEAANLQAFRQGIFCSRAGMNLYKTALREENDTLVSKQDAGYNNIQYSGVDLVYAAQLDAGLTGGASAIFEHDGSRTAAYDEAGNDSSGTAVAGARDGRRYFFVNGNYLTPVFHRTRYFYKKDPFFLEKQPWTWVCPVDCWNNVFCHSRQRQGIVAPFA
jgi:hypothetical protein